MVIKFAERTPDRNSSGAHTEPKRGFTPALWLRLILWIGDQRQAGFLCHRLYPEVLMQ